MAVTFDRIQAARPRVLACQRPPGIRKPQLDLATFAKRALAPYGQRPAAHHLRLLADLNQIADGNYDRLLVLMPPGSAKSTYASLIFPAWWLHRHPATSVIAASHTAELAVQFGRGVRNLVAEHAPALGYGLRQDSHAAHRFTTDSLGHYYATGLGGAITGRRADLVIIDDPLRSLADVQTLAQRDAAWRWYRAELIPRLKPAGRIVIVMTRMHVDDIAGRLMAQDDGWQILRLPALAEGDDPLGRAPGEPLWPAWEDAAALARKRHTVGELAWSSLYQQWPIVADSPLFRSEQIGILESCLDDAQYVRAWDLAGTAASPGRDPDWTVGLKLGRSETGRYIIADIVRLRGGPHDVEESIRKTAVADGPTVAVGLPQDPGQAGKQQVAWLTGRLAGFRVVASPETGSKQVRAMPVAAQIEAGNMSMQRAAWNRAFIDELSEFPTGAKDDQVDALSRAFAMLVTDGPPTRRLRVPLMAR